MLSTCKDPERVISCRYSTYCIPFTKCINTTFPNSILHITILVTHKFKVEDRRRKVATLLAQSMTETEIAQELKVDRSTISRDISLQQKY